jgi:hypothetical protein
MERAASQLRRILSIPQNYKVLFLQGGGTAQFAAVPLNLLHAHAPAAGASDRERNKSVTAEYLVTGVWSEKASQEAAKYLSPHIAFTTKSSNYTNIPEQAQWKAAPAAAPAAAAASASAAPAADAKAAGPSVAYRYYCANETVHGVEWPTVPVPSDPRTVLVADFSSSFCSKPIDVVRDSELLPPPLNAPLTCDGVCALYALHPVCAACGVVLVCLRFDLCGCSEERGARRRDCCDRSRGPSYVRVERVPIRSVAEGAERRAVNAQHTARIRHLCDGTGL